MIGNVVQIGICGAAEYAYLSESNWRDVMDNIIPEKRIPQELFGHERFEFHGVDCDVASIAFMSKLHPHCYWYPYFVTSSEEKASQKYTYASDLYGLAHPEIPADVRKWARDNLSINVCIEKITLSELFADKIEVSHIDVLAMDIEGYEVETFCNYDWKIKPTFIAVEFHYLWIDITQQDFEDLFYRNGYKKVLEERSNVADGIHQTVELQFIYDQ